MPLVGVPARSAAITAAAPHRNAKGEAACPPIATGSTVAVARQSPCDERGAIERASRPRCALSAEVAGGSSRVRVMRSLPMRGDTAVARGG